MSTIILDENMLNRFLGIRGRAEVRDEQGTFHGYFIGADAATIPIPFSGEEIRNAFATPGGRPLSEILADLKARA